MAHWRGPWAHERPRHWPIGNQNFERDDPETPAGAPQSDRVLCSKQSALNRLRTVSGAKRSLMANPEMDGRTWDSDDPEHPEPDGARSQPVSDLDRALVAVKTLTPA